MNERKEQHEIETFFPQGEGSLVLPDETYTRLGAALSREGANVRSVSGGEVVGYPRLSAPVETLAVRWSLFGRLPKSIMVALGLERLLAPLVVRNLIPRCPVCRAIAQKSAALCSYQVPAEGFIALVIRDGTHDISLEERCELLGLERAYVDGRIVRIEEISARDGEPVLELFSAARFSEQQEAIEKWFARGGGTLAVVYLAERDGQGREFGTLVGRWRCPSCDHGVASPSLAEVYDPVPCSRCKGEGWLQIEHGRLQACEECDGFGSTAPLAHAQLGPVTFRNSAVLTAEDLLGRDFEVSSEEARVLHLLCSAGVGGYPMGTPLALLSNVEKIQLATVSARLSVVTGLTCAIDAPALGLMAGVAQREAWIHPSDPSIVMFEPIHHASPRRLLEGPGRGYVELRDVCVGSVSAQSLSFAIGAASAVQSTTGAAILHLFTEIEQRFSQRRKYSQNCDFGAIKRCCRIDCHQAKCESVLEMLGLERHLAEGLARSQVARQRGFSVDDLDLSKRRYRCRECSDGDTGWEGKNCSVCRGMLYDSRVAYLPAGSSTLGQVMLSSLNQVQKALWSYDRVEEVLSRIPSELKGRLSFATNSATLAPAERQLLVVCGALVHVLSHKARQARNAAPERAETLVLLEGGFATTASYQEIVLDLIEQVLRAGATVLCARVPQALESCFRSVVRLGDCEAGPLERVQSRFLDRRFSRWAAPV